MRIEVPAILYNKEEIKASEVIGILDKFELPFAPVAIANWEKDYPYKPTMKYRMAHTGKHLLIHYWVEEDTVRAVATEDNGRVWEDSCCEFFISPTSDNHYYNFECNCATKLLLHYGIPGNRKAAPASIMQNIDRWSSLGNQPFEEKQANGAWQMTLVIPVSALFESSLATWSGLEATGSIYKCGDKLSRPHFLSVIDIPIDTPRFHCPEHFATLSFQ